MPTERRVVITGIGINTPIGSGREEFWKACLDGKQSIEAIPSRWHSYSKFSSTVWSPLPERAFEDPSVSRSDRMKLDPVQVLALGSANSAISDAGVCAELEDEKKSTYRLKELSNERGGVYVGTGNGGLTTYAESSRHYAMSPVDGMLKALESELGQEGAEAAIRDRIADIRKTLQIPRRFNPFSVAMIMPNSSAGTLSLRYNLKGPSQTLSAACASSTVAIGRAFEDIRQGRIDYALAGGAEYLSEGYGGIFRSFDIVQTLAKAREDITTSNRPFDRDRSGFLFCAGGSAMLFLEDYEQAKRRGACCFAELCAYSENTDGSSIMGMDPGGHYIEEMIRSLLAKGQVETGDVDYVNAHGTGTELNDRTEAEVLQRIFGRKPLVNSTKSLIGHTIGASGVIEAAVTAMSLYSKTTHPSLNIDDPVCDLNFVREKNISHPINTAISQSFGFGGHNAGLLLRSIETC